MKNLKQMIHIVKDIKLKASDVILNGQSEDTKVNTFYKKLLDGDF